MQDKEFKNVGMHYKDIWKDENLKPNEKLVLIYLIDYYSLKDGYSYKIREVIEKEIGLARNTLNKVLNSLEEKGYITRAKHKTKTGWNNIYYIHKYLVASKKDTTEAPADAKPSENERKPCETDAKASTNELLVKQKAKLVRELEAEELEEINQLDTELLSKAIDRANSYKPNGYHIGYLLKTYDSVKNNPSKPQREAQSNKPSNNSNNNKKDSTGANTKPLTRYHGTFNEHFRNYAPDELEEQLLKMQAKKRRGLTQ
ncbi:MAG: helix-turn-helix domain-containing protein [Candidatus Onthovivens sp.]|nr:helix-turn-helix domain-containing protein [Candidatus Onthovivens sp.]